MSVLIKSLNDEKLLGLLKDGAVGVLPTDTLYGLVCHAADENAVRRLYALKKREQKPGTVIASDIDQLIKLGIKPRYLNAVAQFWPGPISIVVPAYELQYLHQGKGTVAVRIPSDKKVVSLLRRTGPLLTSSANTPGEPPANDIGQARKYFSDLVDFYVDGGDLEGRQPSTVIRIIDDAIEVLRSGAVNIDETGRIQS